MIKYVQYNNEYNHEIYELFTEVIREDGFIKELTEEEFVGHLFKNHNFKQEGTFLALIYSSILVNKVLPIPCLLYSFLTKNVLI